jgi:hypothetical protein
MKRKWRSRESDCSSDRKRANCSYPPNKSVAGGSSRLFGLVFCIPFNILKGISTSIRTVVLIWKLYKAIEMEQTKRAARVQKGRGPKQRGAARSVTELVVLLLLSLDFLP